MRLRRKSCDRHPPRDAGMSDGAEVDVCGKVGEARKKEWIGERAMAVMRHQGSGAPLRMIVLGGRKTVVHDQQRACLAALRDIFHERLRRRIDLAYVVADRGKERARSIAQRATCERPVGPGEMPAG